MCWMWSEISVKKEDEKNMAALQLYKHCRRGPKDAQEQSVDYFYDVLHKKSVACL